MKECHYEKEQEDEDTLRSYSLLSAVLSLFLNPINNNNNNHQCSAQGHILHCKLRHQGFNFARRQVFHCKLRNLGSVLLGMNKCGGFPLLSAPPLSLSLFKSEQTLRDVKIFQGHLHGGEESGFG